MTRARPTGRGCRYGLKLLAVALAAMSVIACVLTYIVTPVLYARGIAHPARGAAATRTPADLGLVYEDVEFATGDGLVLRAWYLAGGNQAAVIVAHGAGGSRAQTLEQGAALARGGYGVLLLDLRAHGASDGDTTSFGGEDVAAAARYLASRQDVDPSRIGVLGISLGASVALEAAASSDIIGAVVADGASPVAFRDVPRPGTPAHVLDLPFQWMTFQVWKAEGVAGAPPLVEAVGRIAPRRILLISGAASRYEHDVQQKLYAAATEPKALWEIPEAGHTQGWTARRAEYEETIVEFFDGALPAQASR